MELPHISNTMTTPMPQPWKRPITRPTVFKRVELSRQFQFQGVSPSDGSYGGFWGERMRINDDQTFTNPPPPPLQTGHYWASECEGKLFYVEDWYWASTTSKRLYLLEYNPLQRTWPVTTNVITLVPLTKAWEEYWEVFLHWLQKKAKAPELVVQQAIQTCLLATQEVRARKNERERSRRRNQSTWSTEGNC